MPRGPRNRSRDHSGGNEDVGPEQAAASAKIADVVTKLKNGLTADLLHKLRILLSTNSPRTVQPSSSALSRVIRGSVNAEIPDVFTTQLVEIALKFSPAAVKAELSTIERYISRTLPSSSHLLPLLPRLEARVSTYLQTLVDAVEDNDKVTAVSCVLKLLPACSQINVAELLSYADKISTRFYLPLLSTMLDCCRTALLPLQTRLLNLIILLKPSEVGLCLVEWHGWLRVCASFTHHLGPHEALLRPLPGLLRLSATCEAAGLAKEAAWRILQLSVSRGIEPSLEFEELMISGLEGCPTDAIVNAANCYLQHCSVNAGPLLSALIHAGADISSLEPLLQPRASPLADAVVRQGCEVSKQQVADYWHDDSVLEIYARKAESYYRARGAPKSEMEYDVMSMPSNTDRANVGNNSSYLISEVRISGCDDDIDSAVVVDLNEVLDCNGEDGGEIPVELYSSPKRAKLSNEIAPTRSVNHPSTSTSLTTDGGEVHHRLVPSANLQEMLDTFDPTAGPDSD